MAVQLVVSVILVAVISATEARSLEVFVARFAMALIVSFDSRDRLTDRRYWPTGRQHRPWWSTTPTILDGKLQIIP